MVKDNEMMCQSCNQQMKLILKKNTRIGKEKREYVNFIVKGVIYLK